MNYELRIKKSKNTGYTIIETMIAVALFIIIVMSGMGALLNANLLHQKSRDMRSIIDNLSFVMDDMSRNLRTGYNYRCYDSTKNHVSTDFNVPPVSVSCTQGWAVAFETAIGDPNNNQDQWVYSVSNDGKIFKSTDGTMNVVQMTPDEVVIDNISSVFYILGAESPSDGDNQQPLITIRLVGHINYKNIVSPFSIQTSVSQRAIDI